MFEHPFIIVDDRQEIQFFEDTIEAVRRDLQYLVLNRPNHGYAVYKMVAAPEIRGPSPMEMEMEKKRIEDKMLGRSS